LRENSEKGVDMTIEHPDVSFDPFDPRALEDGVPFDLIEWIRRNEPVYQTPSGAWYLSRYADVQAALKDVDVFRAEMGPITGIPAGVSDIPEDQQFLSEILEPRHGKIRRLFNSVLAAHQLREIESEVESECRRLVDLMLAADVADLHEGYAAVIPAFTMTRMMGFDVDVIPLLMKWSADGTLMTRPATPGVPPEGPATYVFLGDQIAQQRALDQPSNRLFRFLLGAEIEGRPLTDREIVTQLHFLLLAGVHTTRAFLTHLVNRLVQEPDLFKTLQQDPGLIPRYLEESLRHDAPVLRTTRLCTKDVEIHDVAIRSGEWVEMGLGSANRDESVYEDAPAFRLDRNDPRSHLAFGSGSHVCPGASLARMEGALVVKVLLERVGEIHTVDGVRYPPLPGSLGHQPVPARLVAR
jgi:cytochrome P450